MTQLKITIPNYLRKVALTKGKRKIYFFEDKKEDLPKKYRDERYIWKKGKLYDKIEKAFVVKNEASSKVPRYQAVAGNEMMRVHERKRMDVIAALREQYIEAIDAIPKPIGLPAFPWKISAKMRSSIGNANWDVDNMWIYHKVFLDTLQHSGILPKDTVLYVPTAGETSFEHVLPGEQTELIFTIETTEPVIKFSGVLHVEVNTKCKEHMAGTIHMLPGKVIMNVGLEKEKNIKMAAGLAAKHCLNYQCHASLPRFVKFLPKYEFMTNLFKEYLIPVSYDD